MQRGKQKAALLFLPAAASFVLMLARNELTSAAASEGLELCIRRVIPAMLPALILTHLLIGVFPSGMNGFVGRTFERLFHIRRDALPALLMGMVAGYPLGAEAAIQCCRLGKCSREEAGRLLVFANNCSPGFLFGIVGAVFPGEKGIALMLLFLQWTISLFLGVMLGKGHAPSVNAGSQDSEVRASLSSMLTAAVKGGGHSVLMLCAFVIFFHVLSAFLPPSVLLRGSIELTGGILALHRGPYASVCAAFLVGWGGLSVAFQVFSLLESSGVSGRAYVPCRLLHGGLMAFCVFLYQLGEGYLLLLLCALLMLVFFVNKGGKTADSGI
jgi:hypothetical protein